MLKFKCGLYCLLTLLIIFSFFSIAVGDEIKPSQIGGGIGSALSDQSSNQMLPRITQESEPQFKSFATTQSITSASQLIGLYVLESFTVYFDSGAIAESKDYNFIGDMALTSNLTMWQRLAMSGFETTVASGAFSISSGILTIYNDLVAENSVANISWDGSYLTTETRIPTAADPFTEIDVWKRVLSSSSSDQDSDGVVDEWDECSDTPSNSCVDNKGCSSSSAVKVVIIPLF